MPKLALRANDMERIAKRREIALKRANEVCEYLCRLGAKEVFLFGSALGDDFRDYSDIDFAVAGLPREHIYRVEAEIERMLSGMPFDLVYLETAPDYLVQKIRKEGKRYACYIPL